MEAFIDILILIQVIIILNITNNLHLKNTVFTLVLKIT